MHQKKYDEIHWQNSTAFTLPKTNQSHLKMMKMDGWKTIVSFWDTFWELHLFSCEHLRFRGGGTVTSYLFSCLAFLRWQVPTFQQPKNPTGEPRTEERWCWTNSSQPMVSFKGHFGNFTRLDLDPRWVIG